MALGRREFPKSLPRPRRVVIQQDFLEGAVTLHDPEGREALVLYEEIPLCDGCEHYDHTRSGAEVKGKQSPCGLGLLCWFRVPDGYCDDEYGDYRLDCERRA